MVKIIAIFLILIQTTSGNNTTMGGKTTLSAFQSCAPPSGFTRWAAYDSTNVCSGGCSGSNIVTSLGNFGAGNVATAAASSNYVASCTNSQPCINMPQFNLGTGIASGTGTYTFYAMLQQQGGGSFYALWGGTGTPIEIARCGNNSQNARVGNTSCTSGSTSFTNGVWYTWVETLNMTSGAASFYVCSGGTCTSDGTGTLASTASTNAVTQLGGPSRDIAWNGEVAEFGYEAGSSITGIGNWSSCKYGI